MFSCVVMITEVMLGVIRRQQACVLFPSLMTSLQMGDADSVGVLLSIFGKAALPHWLAIISNFPETTPPGDYRHILPQMRYVYRMMRMTVLEAELCCLH